MTSSSSSPFTRSTQDNCQFVISILTASLTHKKKKRGGESIISFYESSPQKKNGCQHKNNQFTQQPLNEQAKHSGKTVITTDTLSPDQDSGTVPSTAHTSSFYFPATPCQMGPADSNTPHMRGPVDVTVPALQPRLSDSSFKVLCYSAS